MTRECIIHILDEVNCRLQGLDDNTLSKAQSVLTYSVKGAQFMEKVRAKRWNGKISLLQKTGMTYRYLLHKILPIIINAGYEIKIADYRLENDIKIPEIDEFFFDGYSHGGFKGILDEHQVDAINTITSSGGGLLESATGSGKGQIIAVLSKLYYDFGKVLIIVPRQDLALDLRDTIVAMGMADCGVFYAEAKEVRHITVTTWQSLDNRPEIFDGVNCVICDEVHFASAKILFNLLTKAGKNVPIRIGMTGTLPDDDLSANSIIAAIGPVVKQISAKYLQDIGFLAQCKIFILQYKDSKQLEYISVKNDHDFYIDEIKYQWNNTKRMQHLIAFITTISDDGNTLVLVRNREYGEKLEEMIPDSVFLQGSDKAEVRRSTYDEINKGNNRVLIATYGIASTGINIPRLFNLVMIEPGKKTIGIIQSIGRSLRKSHDKDSANIYHIGSDGKFSKEHLAAVIGIYKKFQYPYTLLEVDYE